MKQLRKLIAASVVLALLAAAIPAYAAPSVPTGKIIIDGEEAALSNPVVYTGGYNYAPMSEILKLMGAEVEWSANTKTVTATRGDSKISVEIGGVWATLNGEKVPMEPTARIISGVTYVPIGFIGRALGYDVEWSAETRTVELTAKSAEGESLSVEFKQRYDKTLTSDEAYKRAITQSGDLKNLVGSMNDLAESRKEVASQYGFAGVNASNSVVDSGSQLRGVLSSLAALDITLDNEKYNRQIIEGACAYSVKASFLGILNAQNSIALKGAEIELSKRDLDNSKLKYELGMMSEVDYEKAKIAHEQLLETQRTNERALENEYLSLNKLLKYDAGNRYNVVLNEEFKPLDKKFLLDNYVTTVVAVSPNVKISENALAKAESDLRLFTGTTPSSYSEAKTAIDKASRSLDDTKKNLEKSIRSGYSDLKDQETQIAKQELDLKKAQTAAETAKVNYDTGNITELQLLNARYAVDATQKGIELLKQKYMLSLYVFMNPFLYTSGSQTATDAK